ncbi:phosphatidate cytidylyltransferase, partial [Patescibacteria group bacterium]|nr:phosphatidate cytidylyltransferase [Patescibacteria group bacterium]
MKKFLTMLLAIPLLFGVVMATPVGTVAEDNGNDPNSEKIILYAGQDMKVGWVDVDNDEEYLNVTYHITEEGWCMTESHLQVGLDPGDFPMTGGKVKNVVPGQFDYKREYDP